MAADSSLAAVHLEGLASLRLGATAPSFIMRSSLPTRSLCVLCACSALSMPTLPSFGRHPSRLPGSSSFHMRSCYSFHLQIDDWLAVHEALKLALKFCSFSAELIRCACSFSCKSKTTLLLKVQLHSFKELLAELRFMHCFFPLASTTMPLHKRENSFGQVDGWLEAMRSSSPPRYISRIKDEKDQISIQEMTKAQYEKWVLKHPSALNMFEAIIKNAKGKEVAVFLDYDGTLSPIVEDPDCAYISEEMRLTVKEVAANFPTAIITGRRRDKVYEFVHLPELYYAGSHGMDIMGPAEGCNGYKADGLQIKDAKGNDVVLFQPASEYLPLMDEICALLKERAKKYRGARVEHNKYCATLHFRCVKEENWLALAEEVEAILTEYPELTLTQGRKVLELRPAIEWHKGKALEFLLEALGLDSSKVFPIYIGDDRTDEDAFKVLIEKGSNCSILVSKVSKDTSAAYSLLDPSQVMEFLQRLVHWNVRRNMGTSSNGNQ